MRIDAVVVATENKIDQNKKSVEENASLTAGNLGFPVMDTQIYHAESTQDADHTFSIEKNQQQSLSDQVNGAINQIANTSDDQMKDLMDSGFHIEEDDVDTIVTVVDKIRLELAKGGQNTEVFGEHIQNGQIEQALSSTNLETEIAKTREQAENLEPVTDSTMKYMLTNDLEPTVANLYQAQHAGSNVVQVSDDLTADSTLSNQIDEVITNAGYEVTEETHQRGLWMVENQIPLTVESFQACQQLTQVECPPKKEVLDQAMAVAVIQGKSPSDAKLTLQLEETRLVMTKQVTAAMEQQGITIDTSDLEQTVKELRQQIIDWSDDQDEAILKTVDPKLTTEQISLYTETNTKVAQIKQMPSPVLTVQPAEEVTINSLYEDGMALKTKMEEASESYQTLMTAPRADLGDSMVKAFQNVDAILEDLNLETTPENQKAVRILAYHNQEITEQSVLETKALDSQVQTVLTRMTPKVVLSMIREDYQPLTATMSELSEKITQIQGQEEEETQSKYSEFLWKLEQQGGISQEERDSFIGIYRLLHQIDQSDGSVVLAAQNAGEEITLKNLLTQVRNTKARGMELSADEKNGEVEEVTKTGTSITDQIQAAYDQNCLKQAADLVTPGILHEMAQKQPEYQNMSPEALLQSMKQEAQSVQVEEEEKAYIQKERQQVLQVYHSSEEVLKYLEEMELPKSVTNIEAMSGFLKQKNQGVRKLFDQIEEKVDFEGIKEELLKEFGEALKTPEDMAKAQKKLADTAEQVMKTMLNDTTISSDQLRDMKIVSKQMTIALDRSKEEEYAIPVLVTDEMANVTLKIVRGKEDKGQVTIFFQTETLGKVAAQLSVSQEKVTGYVASDRRDTLDAMMNQQEGEEDQPQYIFSPDLSLERFQRGILEAAGSQDADEVTTSRLYSIARDFLKNLSQLPVKENQL